MTARILLLTASIAAAPALAGARQAPASAPSPAARPADQGKPPRPSRPHEGQPINVKVEVTITDARPGAAPVKKTVTIVAADGEAGYVRSESQYMNVGATPLNIDAKPEILSGGKIRVGINVQYHLPPSREALAELKTGTPTGTKIRESLYIVLDSGKPLVVTQSADPASDRQVTIEVVATTMK